MPKINFEFKWVCFIYTVYVLYFIQIRLKCLPPTPVGNESVLGLVIAWRWAGNRSLPKPMMTQFTYTYMHYREDFAIWIFQASKTKGLLSQKSHHMYCKIRLHDDVIMETFFRVTGPFLGEFTGPPHKGQWRGALMFSLSCTLNKWLSKQSWGWLFETPLRSLWRNCNEIEVLLQHSCSNLRMFQTDNKYYSAFRTLIWLCLYP